VPIPERFNNILSALKSQTAAGKLQWSEGEDEWTFIAAFPSSSVEIADSGTHERGLYYTLRILNNEARVVDELGLTPNDYDLDTLQDLWKNARRSALGADDRLKEIEELLKSL
jgi:hypothetical protein